MSTKQRITAYGIVVALAATLVTFTAASSLSQHSAAAQQSGGGAKVTIPAGASITPANGHQAFLSPTPCAVNTDCGSRNNA